MSRLPKSMELDRMGIEKMPVPESIKDWLKKLLYKIETIYRLTRQEHEAGGMKTKTWRIVENSNGDLELQHLEGGSWVNRGFKYRGS